MVPILPTRCYCLFAPPVDVSVLVRFQICVSLGEIVGLGLETVEHLVLRENLLRQLDGRVLTFPHLHVLDVSGNLISQILHFEGHFELQKLYLRGNRLTDIK